MAEIHFSQIKSSAFKISSYAGPSVVFDTVAYIEYARLPCDQCLCTM